MKNFQKQGSQNTYDYRNGNPGQSAEQNERNENYRPPNFPVNNDIELNDFANPRDKRSDTMPLRKDYEFAYRV
jgi:hypothetical protein